MLQGCVRRGQAPSRPLFPSGKDMKPESCKGCPYYEREGPVWGHGSPSAKLIVIAQNPWKSEWEVYDPETNQRGIPLAGSIGEVYNRTCGRTGIDRGREYTTNIVKCLNPPGERLHPDAIVKCRPLLERELESLSRARTILTLGQEPFDSLTGKTLSIQHTRARHGKVSGRATNVNPRGWLRGCP